MQFKNDFKKKLKSLGLKKGQTLIVNVDLLKIIIFLKKKKINFKLDDIINPIKEIITEEGNIILYSFYWDFFKSRIFDYNNSKSASGSLSNFLLNDKDFVRTNHPIYSLLVWGKDKKKIYKLKHSDCFNIKSPFGYLIKKKAKLLFINIDFKKTGFPFFHLAEQQVGVYYRFFKTFNGKLIKNGIKKNIYIRMYVRKKNYKILTYYSDKIIDILKQKNSFNRCKGFNSEFNLIDLSTLYNITLKQLKIEKKMMLRKQS